MSLFDRQEAAADRAQRAVFGTVAGFEHHPMARPAGDRNAAPAPDATRPITRGLSLIYTVRATGLNLPENQDRHADHRPGVSTPADLIDVPADAGIDVRTGDRFLRTADGDRFLVASTYTDDHGRILATVTRLD